MDFKKAQYVCDEMLTKGRGYVKTDDIYTKDDDIIIVFYMDIPKLNIKHTKDFISISMEQNIHHMIIVYYSITSSAKKLLMELHNIQTEFFAISELQFNITNHAYVPKHERLSEQDAIAFKQKYGTKLPIILKNDPISKYYNFQSNDIIKVYRKDNEISYRICVVNS
tara:strand:+ start:18 stop:518 length:501 start_codon:yes stop_codon:yes gene_type:complete